MNFSRLFITTLISLAVVATSATFLLAAVTPVHELNGESVTRYVSYDTQTFAFTLSDTKPIPAGTVVLAAQASVNFTRNQTGWDMVDVTADADLLKSNATAAYYGAGLAEAYCTWESILSNNYSSQGSLTPLTHDWIEQNIIYMELYAIAGDSTTAHAVKRFLGMLKGLQDGINRAITDSGSSALKWTLHNVVSLCAQAELGDIETAATVRSKTTTAAPATTTTATPTSTTAGPTTMEPTNSTVAESNPKNVMTFEETGYSAQVETAEVAIKSSTTFGNAADLFDEDKAIPVSHGQFPGDPVRGGKFASHCSALVVRTKDDVIFAHDTWSSMSTMLRQLKTYRLETDVVFSSYPGSISSIDDWLVTGHQLSIQETTNDCCGSNTDAVFLKYGQPEAILVFVRSMAASVWASTSQEWSDIFLQKSSATYNNQWMVIDHKLITDDILKNDKPLPTGTFVVLEQMPGRENCVSEDQTHVLNTKGFWKSFNLAFYQSVRNMNGDQEGCDTVGNFFCYDKYSRSIIYERNASQVVDLDTMEALQQYNGAPYDAFSLVNTATFPGKPCVGCDPVFSYELAIAARYDLTPLNANKGNLSDDLAHYTMSHSPFGAIDTKVSSFKNIKKDPVTGKIQVTYRAKNGPPTSGGQLPVFDWSTYQVPAGANPFFLRHRGQPTRFDFTATSQDSSMDRSMASPWPSTDTNGSNTPDKLGGGAVAAIVICLLVAVVAVVLLVRHNNKQNGSTGWKQQASHGSELETGRGGNSGYSQI